MIKDVCIYCKKKKDLNREHAFPQSLLQKGTRGWIINKHLCVTCNSDLGKLDVVLSKKSHIAFIWDLLQRELGTGVESLHASIFRTTTVGIGPTRLFLSNPVYDDHILLHEFKEDSDGITNSDYLVDVLYPQIILTQYAKGQTGESVVAENREKFITADLNEDIIDYDEQEGIFNLMGNTYIFPPRAAWRSFREPEEFKSKFIKRKSPHTRYNLRVIYPEEGRDSGIANAFCSSFPGKTKVIRDTKKFENPKRFQRPLLARPDQSAIPDFERGIAKVAFHCFLYHYPEFTGHESIFDKIKEFIYTGTPNQFVAEYKNSESENSIYASNKHLRVIDFFVQGEDIGCRIDFFTGLLPGQFSYQITLAGDPDSSTPSCDRTESIPFSVHSESPMKKRILPGYDRGIIHEPRRHEGVLWLPRKV